MASKTVPRRSELRKVKFGNTDMMVTEVCGGTMTWGSFNDKEEMAHDQLDKMWAMGVNFLDTAELYPVGWNYGALTEKWMGNWLGEDGGASAFFVSSSLRRACLCLCRDLCRDRGVPFFRRKMTCGNQLGT